MDSNTVYIVIAVFAAGLIPPCRSQSVGRDRAELIYSDTVESQYCFVNESTIRVKESDVLLNIINKTEDWITASNTTHLFTFPTNGSETNCIYISNSSAHTPTQFHFSLKLFIISMIIDYIGITGSIITIGLHLIFKELRTTSGVLVIILCLFIGMANFMGSIHNITLYYQLNVQLRICFVCYSNYIYRHL